MIKEIKTINEKTLKALSAEEIIQWAATKYGNGIVLASSMGLEDQVLTDMIFRGGFHIDIITLDTGRLFNETYELIARTEKRYGIKIDIFSPDAGALEKMVNAEGVNLFYRSTELRKQCCHVRKIEPLKRALKPYSAWICGLRREQSVTRGDILINAWDEAHQMVKINPLADWSEQEVWDYIRKHDVPYNPLHERGFLSIGCACCTRAVKPGEDIRAGRWWWEQPEQKECGLHLVDGKLVRKKN